VRTVIYTGKGGVGKTSLAAATALGAAKHGHETLVVSTDSAHSLGDSLGVRLGPDPVAVKPHLWGLEIDVLTELERHWKEVHSYLLTLLASQGVEEVTAQEVVILPGMELITALLNLDLFEREGRFDTVVLDTAPTADTLRLLSFPNAAEWYFEHLFQFQRRIARVVRATVGHGMRTPVPSDNFFRSIQELHDRFVRVRDLLNDERRSTVRLVVNPERMVIAETQRAYTYLCLFGLAVELIVVNRVFPTAAASGYFEKTREQQQANLDLLEELFGTMPRLTVPRYPTEVLGIPSLERLAQDVFGEADPVKRWPTEAPLRFVTRDGKPTIELKLPYADPKDVELSRKGDVLFLRVGAYRRSIVLPVAYVASPVERAFFDGPTFVVRFQGTLHEGTRLKAAATR
jgi:arsenite-transporting ATPase